MKTIIIALVLLTGVLSQEITPQALQTLWAAWKQQYHVEYQDEAEDAKRYSVFVENYQYIIEWNAAGNTATLALNKFSDLTSEEFGAMYCGTFPATEEMIEETPVLNLSTVGIPAAWDWRTQGAVTPIKDQGQCGSCWAFATVASIEGAYQISGHTLTSFSEQQVVDCDTACQACNGGWPSYGIQYAAKSGLETESEYPYKAVKGQCQYSSSEAIKTGVTGPSNVQTKSSVALETAIYKQPVAVVVEADQKVFQSYSSGVITSGCGTSTDHAITAVGYGTINGVGAFIVKNSWGTSWGVNGYVYIASSQSINNGLGACGILSGPVVPVW